MPEAAVPDAVPGPDSRAGGVAGAGRLVASTARGAGLPPPVVAVAGVACRGGVLVAGGRDIAEECAVALSYNRVSHAVMMASPADLEDFALGFSLNEGILGGAEQIEELEVVVADGGIELRMWIDPARMGVLDRRRRRMAGPSGCGLCGLESLSDAVRPPPRVGEGRAVRVEDVFAAAASLYPAQVLNHATRAVHAAGFWRPGAGLVAVREDVGRHNALDKLAGALARAGEDASAGVLLMTSRVSVELVQKAAVLGATILVAVSAPTALALRVAEAAGITVVGVARQDGFEVFTHPWRVRA
ncbi:MAG: formate dehydrogenase accessory sulfurtransferase FdhD [Janthinobacterium lividum]